MDILQSWIASATREVLGNIEQARGAESVNTIHSVSTIYTETLQALLVLIEQRLIDQALAGIRRALHVSPLRLQLGRQRVAIAGPILRATGIAVPSLTYSAGRLRLDAIARTIAKSSRANSTILAVPAMDGHE